MSRRTLLLLDSIWKENFINFKDLNYSPFRGDTPIYGDKIAPYCPTKQSWLEQVYEVYKLRLESNNIVLYIRVDKYDLWI